MKSDQIQDALSSVAEIASFVLSLLELILTRILPLLGFAGGHLLLHLGSLLSSLVDPAAAGRYSRRGESSSYSWDDPQLLPAVEEDLNAEEEGEDVQADDDYQGTLESSKSYNAGKPEKTSLTDEILLLPSFPEKEDAADAAEYENVELPNSAPREVHVTDFHDATDENQPIRGDGVYGHVTAESSPSDVQEFDRSPLDAAGTNLNVAEVRHVSPFVPDVHDATEEEQLRGSDKVAHSSPSDMEWPAASNSDVAVVEASHVSPKPDVAGVDPGRTSPDAESSVRAVDMEQPPSAASGSLGPEELRKNNSSRRRSRRIRVLPPSLSQVRRTVMQRSRRGSPSPHSASPANVLAPSPSPIQKKQLRGSRRRAARSSPTYNSFVRRFREHFLLGPA